MATMRYRMRWGQTKDSMKHHCLLECPARLLWIWNGVTACQQYRGFKWHAGSLQETSLCRYCFNMQKSAQLVIVNHHNKFKKHEETLKKQHAYSAEQVADLPDTRAIFCFVLPPLPKMKASRLLRLLGSWLWSALSYTRGHYITNPDNAHYYQKNLWTLPYICIVSSTQKG